MKKKQSKEVEDTFKIACNKLRSLVKADIRTSGLSVVSRKLNYINQMPGATLPVNGLTHTDTIEIYQQCITEHIQKLQKEKETAL